MKKTSYLILLFLLTNLGNLFGQEYLTYYERCNAADEQIYLKNYAVALEKFELAFKDVSYVHNEQYVKASKCAILIQRYDKAYTYICQLRKQGDSNRFLDKKMFKSFKKSDWYQKYKDNVLSYDKIFQASIHQKYAYLIDSLHYIDQYIIRKNKKYKGKYIIPKEKIPENVWDLDQSNIEILVKLIQEYGFPSEQLVGVHRYKQAVVILLHNLRLHPNEKYHEIALNAVKTGEYLPENYLLMYEQYSNNNGITYYTTWDKDLSAKNLARLESNRKQIGLKPLKAYSIKNRGLKMRIKWGIFRR